MKVLEVIEQIENEINEYSRRLDFLHQMKVYLSGSLTAYTFENEEGCLCFPTDIHPATFEEDDEEEETYAAEERLAVAEDNAAIVSDSKPKGFAVWEYSMDTGEVNCSNCGYELGDRAHLYCPRCNTIMENYESVRALIKKYQRKSKGILCNLCEFEHCSAGECRQCAQYQKNDKDGFKCRCLKIHDGEYCPYFSEKENDDET